MWYYKRRQTICLFFVCFWEDIVTCINSPLGVSSWLEIVRNVWRASQQHLLCSSRGPGITSSLIFCFYHSLSSLIHLFPQPVREFILSSLHPFMQSSTRPCCPLHVVACSYWDEDMWSLACYTCRTYGPPSGVVGALQKCNFIKKKISSSVNLYSVNQKIYKFFLFLYLFFRGKSWLCRRRRRLLTSCSVEKRPLLLDAFLFLLF